MRERIVKKIVVILIIITMLQTQIVSIANVVYAITTGATGTVEEVNENDKESEGLGTEIGGNVGNVDEEMPTEENPVDEKTGDEEPDEEPIENPIEEPIENPIEENPVEEPSDVPQEEVPKEPEIVVEPNIELNIKSENSSIYKGYLYANATSDLRYETNYNTIEEVIITGAENGISNVIVTENEDKIKMITATRLALLNDIYYKKTRVLVSEFESVLGKDGIINVFDADGDYVGNISKDSTVENGYYVYDFIYYTNNVRFEFSSPIADGKIQIVNDKAIKEDSLYSREQIATFSTINITASAEMVIGEQVLRVENEGDITLQETEAKVEIELDKTELSTEKTNALTMTLTLKTDAERYELFEKPVIEIEMPSNISDLTIEGVNLLYKNGLSLKYWEVVENDRKHKVIRIELDGAQSVYTPGIVQEGTTLVLYTNVEVNKLTANTSENLKLTYTNQDSVRQAYKLEGKNAEEVLLTFVAKHGMLKGLAGKNDVTQNAGNSYEEVIDKLELKSESGAQIVTITGSIVNNFETEVNDVVVIGRIPFIGNKNGNDQELFSDFDTTLNSEVTTTGNITEVYYSENGDAKIDDESWTQDVTDISKYKSYKIVIKEGTLKKGEKVDFVYETLVAENLGYNLKSYATYTVTYKLDNQELSGNCTIALVSEEKELEADDLENKEETEKLQIGTQVSQGGKILTEEDTVFERQILKYTVVVTNISNEVLTNIKLIGKAENANMYTWKYIETEDYFAAEEGEVYISRMYEEDTDGTRSQDEMVIESLKPGESKTFEYQVITKMLPEENNEEIENKTEQLVADEMVEEVKDIFVYGVITVTADNITEKIIETIKNKVVDAELEVRLGYAGTEDINEEDALTNFELKVYTYVKNITDKTLKNVKVSFVVPEELEHDENEFTFGAEDLEKEIIETTNGKIVSFVIPEIKAGNSREIYISTLIKPYDTSIASNVVTINAYAETENEIYTANDYKKLTKQSETVLEHKWVANQTKEILEDGDEIIYTFTIKNAGLVSMGNVEVENVIPDGLEIVSVKMQKGEEEFTVYQGTKNVYSRLHLDSGEEATLTIQCIVNRKLFARDQDSIDNKIAVNKGLKTGFETEVISYKINNKNITVEVSEEPKEDNNSQNTNNGNNSGNTSNNNQNNNNSNNNNNTVNKNPEQVINKPTEPVQNKTYIISGKVWLDKNKDGINNNNEKGEQAVVVLLYKTTSKGDITSKVAETVTNQNGEYTFTGVENGTYVVVFVYDTGVYNSTKYKVATANTTENSDAITKAVNLENTKLVAGITDVITIKDAGAINIDLGLVDKNEFDMSLEKYIDNVKVINPEGTKIYKCEEKQNIKVEIRSKYYKKSTVEITYKIKVNNTGEVAGYVNRIVDYVPNNVKFDNAKNPDWYYGDDGNLYYKGLVGQEIVAGETKEIQLVLTKTLEDGEALKLENGAEIAEATNSMGLEDIDSVPGNKEMSEDDFGKVTLTISISTGSVSIRIVAFIITLTIVAIVVYVTKFKFTKKVYR